MTASVVCGRVREQVSLLLDGELSQLEHRMLDSHLARCPVCSAYAESVRTFTNELRSAPQEELPAPVVVRLPRRAVLGRLQLVASAALALVAVGLATQLAPGPQSLAPADARPIKQFQTRLELEKELAIIELVQYRTGNAPSTTIL